MDVAAYAIRVFFIYIFSYLAARILTKKAISEMTAYEMVGIILISNVAAEPLVTKVVSKTILGTGLLVLFITIASRLALVDKLTPIMEHTPTIVIKNGQIDKNALKKSLLSINQLLGELRQQGYDNVTEVEFAILEPQGKLSVFPKSQNRPLQPQDLGISTKYEGLTLPLIIDGSIIEKNLEHVNLTKEWLLQELRRQKIDDISTVSLAQLDTQGNVNISLKNE